MVAAFGAVMSVGFLAANEPVSALVVALPALVAVVANLVRRNGAP
jgi:hypothetical protein